MPPQFCSKDKNFDVLSGKAGSHSASSDGSSLGLTAHAADPLTDFPLQLHGDLCWDPAAFESFPEKYIVKLSHADIAAIGKAIGSFKTLGLAPSYLEPSNFPLPSELHYRLRYVSDIVHSGVGFAVIRGLDPRNYSEVDNVIAYCGIASHIGAQRSTNNKGMSMVHIRDASKDPKPQNREAEKKLAPSKLRDGMKFHADRVYADIVGLYVKGKAAVGGDQYLASFWTIYNKLRDQAPDVLQVLAEEWQWSPLQKTGTEQDPSDRMPAMLRSTDGRVMLQVVWQPFFDNPRLATPAQWRALETVQRLAEECCIKLDQRPGDMQFINNFAILHTRSAFQDAPGMTRHLMRLGLRDPEKAWEMPRQYADVFGKGFLKGLALQEQPT